MASLKERVTAKVDRLRAKYTWLDHTVRMLQHYSSVDGNAQAGAVTFFGFLSVFPILALAFVVVGVLSQVYPDIKPQMVAELDKMLPGLIGTGKGEIPLSDIEQAAGAVGIVGFVALLYSGLGWLSGMRVALEVMFAMPKREQPNFVMGKLRDLTALALIGLTLLVSVALSGAVAGFSGLILDWVGVDQTSAAPAALLAVFGRALAIVASTVLLLTMYKLLVEPHIPRRALVRGAVLGAVGFEILKMVANVLLGLTKEQPAFQAFGVALILVVWINYFSRLVMYSAAWAYTASSALERRTTEARRAPGAVLAGSDDEPETHPETEHGGRVSRLALAGVAAAVVAVVTRRSRRDS